MHPGGLNFVAFFLDDGTVAGDAKALRHFVDSFETSMAEIGLTLATEKCEAIPAAGARTTVDRDAFRGWIWRGDMWRWVFQIAGDTPWKL